MSLLTRFRTMLGGVAIAQIIGIAATPILTRLYEPEAFGLQTLVFGFAVALSVLGTLRLDLALLLVNDEEVSEVLAIIAVCSAGVVSVLSIALLLFAERVTTVTHQNVTTIFALSIPMLVATVVTQVTTALLSRNKQFGPIARSGIVNQFIYALAAFALAPLSNVGVSYARALGQIAGIVSLLFGLKRSSVPRPKIPTASRLEQLWARFRQFVLYNTPYSLISTITRETPIYAFTFAGAVASAGFYGLARMLISLPAVVSTAALSQVFYREAVEMRGSPRLQQLTTSLLKLSMRGPALLFALVAAWGDYLFAIVFGDRWITAGVYAMLLAPAAWLSLQTGWPERMFEVAMRQDVSFRIQIMFDTLSAVVVFVPLAFNYDPIVTVVGFTLVNCLYHLTFLTAIFAVSNFRLRILRRTIVQGVSLFGLGYVVFFGGRWMLGTSIQSAGVSVVLALLMSLIVGLIDFRSARRSFELSEVKP